MRLDQYSKFFNFKKLKDLNSDALKVIAANVGINLSQAGAMKGKLMNDWSIYAKLTKAGWKNLPEWIARPPPDWTPEVTPAPAPAAAPAPAPAAALLLSGGVGGGAGGVSPGALQVQPQPPKFISIDGRAAVDLWNGTFRWATPEDLGARAISLYPLNITDSGLHWLKLQRLGHTPTPLQLPP